MLSLAKASTLCLARQLIAPLYANPVLAALVTSVVLALPAGGWFLGRASGNTISVLLADPTLARTFLLAISLGAATGGLCMAMLAPHFSVLDEQLQATPLPRLQLIAGAMLAPLLIPLAWISLTVGSFLTAVIANPAVSALAAATVAMLGVTVFVSGAALGSGLPHLRAERPTAIALPILLVPLWMLAGTASGWDALDGLPAAAVSALHGGTHVFWLVSGLLLLIAGAGWALHAALPRPTARASAPTLVLLPVPASPVLASVAATLKVLGRRGDLRGNAWAVLVATPIIGLIVHTASPIPQTAGLFAMAAALLGSVTIVLATPAVVAAPSWMWTTTGRGPGAVGASLVAGIACQALVLAGSIAPLALTGALDKDVLAILPATGCLTAAAALTAGTIAPWDPAESARQAVTMAVFFVLALGLFKPLRWATAALSNQGATEPVAAVATAGAVLVIALIATSIAIYSKEKKA
jgi:hypothetical protein